MNKIRVTAVILFYSIHLTHCCQRVDPPITDAALGKFKPSTGSDQTI